MCADKTDKTAARCKCMPISSSSEISHHIRSLGWHCSNFCIRPSHSLTHSLTPSAGDDYLRSLSYMLAAYSLQRRRRTEGGGAHAECIARKKEVLDGNMLTQKHHTDRAAVRVTRSVYACQFIAACYVGANTYHRYKKHLICYDTRIEIASLYMRA